MAKLPESGREADYGRFTRDLWDGLSPKYNFYVNRWRRTLEFLRDQHWSTLKEFDLQVLPDWRRFPLQNFVLAFYNDYLTDYLKSEVRYSAVPASADPRDIDAAELAEQLMAFLWDRMNLDRKRIDLGAWIVACGTGAVRIYWDVDTGNQIPLGIPTPDGGFIPVDPETLAPLQQGEPTMVDAGEIGIEVISPQFVRWADNPAHGVMVGMLVSEEQAKAWWGPDVAKSLSYVDTHEGISADLNQIQQPGITPSSDKRALVIEHYIPTCSMYPDGLWWTCSGNGTIMITPPWPLPAGRVPIVSFRWIPIPGEEHIGTSPIYGLTFQNKMYEEITAKILEWYQKAKPKWLLKAGGGVTHGDLTDEPFQELVVNQGAEPEMLQVDDAPSGLFQILGLVQSDMVSTSGRAFASGDELPEGLATQRIRTPPEMKVTKAIGTAHICAKASWREVGETLMHYVGVFYNEPRVVAIQGPDKGFLWREFTGEKLRRDGDLAAMIRVDEIPLFPQNRQNLRDTVIAVLQTQAGQILFAGPDGTIDMERVNSALKATGLDVNMDLLDPDVLEARNEIIEFQNLQQDSQPPQLQPWQDSMVHYNEKTRYLKSMRFRAWSDHARQAFLQNVQEHEQRLNEQAQAEAQAMVDQERELRRVREQEELRADVMKEWATSLIALVAETAGLEIQDIMGLLERPKTTPTESTS